MTTRDEGKIEIHIGHEVVVYTVRPDLSVQTHKTQCMVPMVSLTPEERVKLETRLADMGIKSVRVVEGPNGTVGFMSSESSTYRGSWRKVSL